MNTVNSTGAHHEDHAHHFKSANHQYISNKEGIWLFMATEILMFGGLFVAYSIYHSKFPEMFAQGAKFLDWKLGFINTLVLIGSSLTMALGIYYCQLNNKSKAALMLFLTVLCGAVFMVIKYFEYTHKFHMGIYPGKFLDVVAVGNNAEVQQILGQGTTIFQNLGLYFGFYYCMSGLHGIHVLLGMGLITWCFFRCLRGDFNSKYYTPVEGVGIFWHIIDLIWIFLFPLLYLVG
ncbi:MAG: cytochrome c oxidase subunit 3 family protein [Pseudobdellovibrionaceae bacterium]|jgi:cytochrome c oxidase subunit 3